MTDFDQAAYDELPDFASDDLAVVPDADHGYLKGMWTSASFGDQRSTGLDAALAEDTVLAHGMVQSFVNAFARDGRYAVTFDPSMSTAGTDMSTRKVLITPAPIADMSISAEEAGLILTGLAVHEICHPRYGTETAEAVRATFGPYAVVANRLSNLLDDVRIERRFVADYPGYAGVFKPTLAYVAQAGSKKGHRELTLADEPTNFAIGVIRYPEHHDVAPEARAEAAWWQDWAARGSREDAPKAHVDFVREALAHIVAQAQSEAKAASQKQGPQATQSQGEGAGKGTDAQQGGEPQGGPDTAREDPNRMPPETTEKPADQMGDRELSQKAGAASVAKRDTSEDDGGLDPTCNSARVDDAARENGVSTRTINAIRDEAEEIIQQAAALEDDGHGSKVDVIMSTNGLKVSQNSKNLRASDAATRHVADAILRSRTGHTAVEPFRKAGRLDQRGLDRVAHGDTRVFEKRTAASPGRYLVWVMVDTSSSMQDEIGEAAQVAQAMAAATAGTPTVRMTIWGWTTQYRTRIGTSHASAIRVWETGMPSAKTFDLADVRQGGTPDSTILSWASRAIRSAARRGEKPVVIFVSDGQGAANLGERVEEARRAGVDVYSVSFGGGLGEATQLVRYGKGNYVPFAGSVTATARGLGKLFARITQSR